MKFQSPLELIRKYFRLPDKKKFLAYLKINRTPVIWWNEEVEAKRNKEKLRKERIYSLYRSDKK